MLYSLTDKLKFNDSPQIEIKGKTLTIDNSAVTVLELMDIAQNEGDLECAKACISLLFDEKDKKTIEKLKLNIEDYMTLAMTAMDLALGNDPDAKNGSEQ